MPLDISKIESMIDEHEKLLDEVGDEPDDDTDLDLSAIESQIEFEEKDPLPVADQMDIARQTYGDEAVDAAIMNRQNIEPITDNPLIDKSKDYSETMTDPKDVGSDLAQKMMDIDKENKGIDQTPTPKTPGAPVSQEPTPKDDPKEYLKALSDENFTTLRSQAEGTLKRDEAVAIAGKKEAEKWENLTPTGKMYRQLENLGASVSMGVTGISEGLWRTPDTANKILGAASNITEKYGKKIGLPNWLFSSVEEVIGVDPLKEIAKVANPVADRLAKYQKDAPKKYKVFKRLADKGKEIEDAVKLASKTGDYSKVIEIFKDPEAWVTSIGQAAPSLAIVLASGGSIKLAALLESLEVSTGYADFKKRTGINISDEEFTSALFRVALINGWLESIGAKGLLSSGTGFGKQVAKGAVKEGILTEPVQEANINEAIRNAYDKKRKLTQGIIQSIMGGTSMGAGTSAVTSTVEPRRLDIPGSEEQVAKVMNSIRDVLEKKYNAITPEEQAEALSNMSVDEISGLTKDVSGLTETEKNSIFSEIMGQIPTEDPTAKTVLDAGPLAGISPKTDQVPRETIPEETVINPEQKKSETMKAVRDVLSEKYGAKTPQDMARVLSEMGDTGAYNLVKEVGDLTDEETASMISEVIETAPLDADLLAMRDKGKKIEKGVEEKGKVVEETIPAPKKEAVKEEAPDKITEAKIDEKSPEKPGVEKQSSKDLQDKIDELEDSLEEQGVDVYKLYNPSLQESLSSEKGRKKFEDNNPGWKPMPKELQDLYNQRDKVDKEDLSTSYKDIKSKKPKSVGDKEFSSVLDEVYSLKPDSNQAVYFASTYTDKASSNPSTFKSIYAKLSELRGLIDQSVDYFPEFQVLYNKDGSISFKANRVAGSVLDMNVVLDSAKIYDSMYKYFNKSDGGMLDAVKDFFQTKIKEPGKKETTQKRLAKPKGAEKKTAPTLKKSDKFKTPKETKKEEPFIPKSAVEKHAKPIVDKWNEKLPGHKVEFVKSVVDVPQSVQDRIKKKGGELDTYTTEEVYDRSTKTVYMIADNIPDNKSVERVMAHSMLGHVAMETVFGPYYPELLRKVNNLKRYGPVSLQKIVNEVSRRYPGITGDQEAMEIIAVMAEKGINRNFVEKVFSKIRSFLRKQGFILKFRNSDLRAMISKASEGVVTEQTREQNIVSFSKRVEENKERLETEAKSILDDRRKEWGVIKLAFERSLGWTKKSRAAWLDILPFNVIAELGENSLEGMQKLYEIFEDQAAYENQLVEEVARTAQEMWQWANKRDWGKLKRVNKREAELLSETMTESRIFGVDPTTEEYSPLIDIEEKKSSRKLLAKEEREARNRIALLNRRIKHHPGDNNAPWFKEIKEINKKLNHVFNELKEIKTALEHESNREDNYPRIVTMYKRLSPKGRGFYSKIKKFYEDRRDLYEKFVTDKIKKEAALVENDLTEDYKKDLEETTDAMKRQAKKENFEWDKKVRDKELKDALEFLEKEFEEYRTQGPYFPLARHGNYWVGGVKRENGKIVAEYYKKFDSIPDQKRDFNRLEAQGYEGYKKGDPVDYGKDSTVKNVMDPGISASQVTHITKILDEKLKKAPVSKEIKGLLYQMHLRSFPEMSMKKHDLHARKVPGYSTDWIRDFADNGFHGSKQLARMKYSADIRKQMATLKKNIKKSRDRNFAQELFDKSNEQLAWILNPQSASWSNALTSLGFMNFLGVSVAAGGTNLGQTLLIAWPIMVAEFGGKGTMSGTYRAIGELSIASKDLAVGKGHVELSKSLAEEWGGDTKRMIDEMLASGKITKTLGYDIVGLTDKQSHKYRPAIEKTKKFVAAIFHHTERFNRETTSVATYRLARQNGLSHKKAVAKVRMILDSTHYNYEPFNKPKILQGDIMKVTLLFKQYAINTMFRVFWLTYAATKGTTGRNLNRMRRTFGKEEIEYFERFTPEERRQARKAMVGILTTHFVAGGLNALPYLPIVFLMANFFFGGDEDEQWDAETAAYDWISESLGTSKTGKSLANMIKTGVIGEVFGPGLSNRISIANPAWRKSNREMTGPESYQYYTEQILGPVYGMVANWVLGYHFYSKGRKYKGVERAMPSAIKAGMKAYRYATEGVTDIKGNVIMPKEDLTASEIALQLLGWSPQSVLNMYADRGQVMNKMKKIDNRKRELLEKLDIARENEDDDMYDDIMDKIDRFSDKNPDHEITYKDIKRSRKSRERRREGTVKGVYFPKKHEALKEKYEER